MNKIDFLIAITFFGAALITRLPLVETYQSHWDGPQYSIGVVSYSLEQHTPAPPGYPLYIFLGFVVNLFVNDPHRSLIFVSMSFAGITAALLYLAGKTIFSKGVGVIASFLYLSGPTFYFFGLTAYPYGGLPILALLLGIVVFYSLSKRNVALLLGAIFALAIGFRPQETPMFLPLFLLGFFSLSSQEKSKAIGSFAVVLLVWLVPFLFVVGGIERYMSAISVFLQQGALTPFSIPKLFDHIARVGKGAFLSFGVSLGFLLYYIQPLSKKNKLLFYLFAAWIIPSLAVNLFIRSDHAGYQMTYLSALMLLIAHAIWSIFKQKKGRLLLVLLLLVGFNLWLFFRDRDPMMLSEYIPTSFHHSEIRKNDVEMRLKTTYIAENFNPQKTLILTSAQAWRPYMYHLPDFTVLNLEALYTRDEAYHHEIRSARHWKGEMNRSENSIFAVTEELQSLIFIDQDACRQPFAAELNVILLPGNRCIGVLSVTPGERYAYTYHRFEKQ